MLYKGVAVASLRHRCLPQILPPNTPPPTLVPHSQPHLPQLHIHCSSPCIPPRPAPIIIPTPSSLPLTLHLGPHTCPLAHPPMLTPRPLPLRRHYCNPDSLFIPMLCAQLPIPSLHPHPPPLCPLPLTLENHSITPRVTPDPVLPCSGPNQSLCTELPTSWSPEAPLHCR